MTNVIISNNTSYFNGGGIYKPVISVLTLKNSIISNNIAPTSDYFGGGGGIYNVGETRLVNSAIYYNNTNKTGGGIFNSFSGSTFQSQLLLTNTTISNNSAADGGGIGTATDTIATLNNSTVSANTATQTGGGINNGWIVNIKNSIISGNTSPIGSDCNGTLVSEDYNLIQNPIDCTINGITNHDIIGQNPLLGPLKDNGGPTFTRALLADSPAIDAGNPAIPGSGGSACEAMDQRSQVRPIDGNGDSIATCDIGAFEFVPAAGPDNSVYLPIVVKNH